jgi:hypothetical protein
MKLLISGGGPLGPEGRTALSAESLAGEELFVLPVMERVPKGRETREERWPAADGRAGPFRFRKE